MQTPPKIAPAQRDWATAVKSSSKFISRHSILNNRCVSFPGPEAPNGQKPGQKMLIALYLPPMRLQPYLDSYEIRPHIWGTAIEFQSSHRPHLQQETCESLKDFTHRTLLCCSSLKLKLWLPAWIKLSRTPLFMMHPTSCGSRITPWFLRDLKATRDTQRSQSLISI